MHVTWDLSCNTTVFTASQAWQSTCNPNTWEGETQWHQWIPNRPGDTHNKTLCQNQKQRKGQKANSKVHPVSQLSEHSINLQLAFCSCFGLGTGDWNQRLTYAKYSHYLWTTCLAQPLYFKEDLIGFIMLLSPQSSGLECPSFSLTRAPGTRSHTWFPTGFTQHG